MKKKVKELINGEKSFIVGYLTKSEKKMGRSLVIDLNSGYKSNFRLVDHRTIQSIVVGNVRYVRK